jgi:hypothetical protein
MCAHSPAAGARRRQSLDIGGAANLRSVHLRTLMGSNGGRSGVERLYVSSREVSTHRPWTGESLA